MQNYNDPYNQPPQQQGFNQPPQQGFNQPPQQYNNNNQPQGFNQPPQQPPQNNVSYNDDTNNNNNDNDDIEQNLMGKEEEGGGLLANSRLGFIRKVYLILVTMLSLVVIMTIISVNSPSFRLFQYQNLWLYITACVAAFAIQIAVFCYPGVAKKVPSNYILCMSFALCFAYMVSAICSLYQDDGQLDVVLIAASLTFAVSVALTIYAMTTKTDFTMMGGLLFSLIMVMFCMGIFMWIFGTSQFLNTLYCCFGVMLYSLFLIYDTQLIVGGKYKRFSLGYDHYILGAMMLFIDIIQLFLYLLSLLARK